MRFFLLLLVTFLYGCPLRANPVYDEAIKRASSNPSSESIVELGGHLRGSARNTKPTARGEYYFKIQKALLSAPGHAKYFAESLEKQRGALKEGQFRGSYNDAKYRIIVETLVHLPSPETIEVLGKYLADERDNTYDEQFISDDAMPPVNTSLLAAHTLANIGLRNAPAKSKYPFPTKDDGKEMEIYREWFQKVIAGEITVSFMGQAVEYRFKPDSTWDTIPISNPPDDVVQLPAPESMKQEAKAVSQVASDKSWLWLMIAAFSGGAVLFSLLLWKKKIRA